MNLTSVLLMIIFIAMAASAFYFWKKGQNMLFRHITLKEIFLNPFKIRDKMMEEEWKLFRKYSRYQAWCFFGGILIMILLIFLQGMFHFF